MIVAFDPGRNIGVAFVTSTGALEWRSIVDSRALSDLTLPAGATVVVGDGTGSAALIGELTAMGLKPKVVVERSTTLEARSLYFRDHPPRGWQRLLPSGMRSPPRSIDDYAAYAIALRWLAERDGAEGWAVR